MNCPSCGKQFPHDDLVEYYCDNCKKHVKNEARLQAIQQDWYSRKRDPKKDSILYIAKYLNLVGEYTNNNYDNGLIRDCPIDWYKRVLLETRTKWGGNKLIEHWPELVDLDKLAIKIKDLVNQRYEVIVNESLKLIKSIRVKGHEEALRMFGYDSIEDVIRHFWYIYQGLASFEELASNRMEHLYKYYREIELGMIYQDLKYPDFLNAMPDACVLLQNIFSSTLALLNAYKNEDKPAIQFWKDSYV
ncbi:MAG: hypothetical protein ACFFCS_06060 [Candidatus Hodarchaeota archaeon]